MTVFYQQKPKNLAFIGISEKTGGYAALLFYFAALQSEFPLLQNGLLPLQIIFAGKRTEP